MATTFIYAIKATGNKSLDYDKENKEAKIEKEPVNNKNDSRDSLSYVTRDKKGNTYKLSANYLEKMKDYIRKDEKGNITFKTLTTGINCSTIDTYKEWETVRKKRNPKNGSKGNLQYCIVQNFGVELNPEIANEIGVKFAREYLKDYQCVVSTHINTGLVHNHIEFNATSFTTGKKFDDNLKVIGEIRKISDKFCKEYELDVLENTEEFNYIIYKDENGKTKVYEPTERKNKKLEGEASDKNSYLNTSQLKTFKLNEESHMETIKNDIERLLPHVESYEDLLQQLENCSYEIKDKTKQGEWRKHISFKAPNWEKAVRDNSLGEEYEREYLTRRILKNKDIEKENSRMLSVKENHNVSTKEVEDKNIYKYGSVSIENLDDEFRYRRRKSDASYVRIARSVIEKLIIQDTKRMNQEVNKIMEQAMFIKSEQRPKTEGKNRRQQYLIDRINSNLNTLRFIEKKNIKSFEQINSIVTTLYDKRNQCYEQLKTIKDALKNANTNIAIIDKYNTLKENIAKNEHSPDYILYHKKNDEMLLKNFEEVLKEKNLLGSEKQEKYKENYIKYNDAFIQLSSALEQVNRNIKEYDQCIYNINQADRNSTKQYEKQIEKYYQTKENYKYSNRGIEEQKEQESKPELEKENEIER